MNGRRKLATTAQALFLASCVFLPGLSRGEGARVQAPADAALLAGRWQRTDGGYLLELKDIQPDGVLTALYFNPRPINVSRSEWRRMSDRLQVFVELRDVNYPGSTYLLVHVRESDRLEGYYRHALSGQTFDVSFTRAR